MLASKFASLSINIVAGLGYGGLFAVLAANSAGFPLFPSEIILPLTGVLAQQGQFKLAQAIIVAILAQVVGALFAYFIARTGGIPLIKKYGRYVFFRNREMEFTQRWFERYGTWLVLAGSTMPFLKSYVAYPAGIARLPLTKFIPANLAGSTIWTVVLITIGYKLSDQLPAIDRFLRQFTLLIVLLVALIIGAFIWTRLKHRRAQ